MFDCTCNYIKSHIRDKSMKSKVDKSTHLQDRKTLRDWIEKSGSILEGEIDSDFDGRNRVDGDNGID